MSDYEQNVVEPVVIKDGLTVDVNTMHGLNALVHWLTGFEAGGNGRVPGHFELVMHLRSLRSAHRKDKEK